MYFKLITICLSLLLVFGACQGGDNEATAESKTEEQQSDSEMIRYTILKKGFNSEIKEGGDLVIKNEAEFDTLWKDLHANISIMPERPEIDFEQEMLVAVFMGEMPSTGYWVHLDTIYATDKNLIVQATTNTSPDSTSEIFDIPTQPFFIAVVDKIDLPVQFDFRSAEDGPR